MMDPIRNFSFPPDQPHPLASFHDSCHPIVIPLLCTDFIPGVIGLCSRTQLESVFSKTKSPNFPSFTDSVNVHFRVSSLMPGTIQVSVVDFQGPPSTSTPPTFVKVSLGKREFQTSDKGDFSFPLTNFRDSLVVKLLDAAGNETAHTGIQTMSIVQKVSWDEIFFFDGGGCVHLKLRFILNEDDRARIRLKREEALKKKQENIPKANEISDAARSTGGSVTSSMQAGHEESDLRARTLTVGSLDTVTTQASLLPNADISPDDPQSNSGRERSTLKKKKPRNEVHHLQANQNVKKHETESSQLNVHPHQVKEDSSRLVYSGSYVAETSSLSFLRKDEDDVVKSEQPVSLEKTPSNVRNLVTAFESSLAKDSKSSEKVPAVGSETKKVGKEGYRKDYGPKHFSKSEKGSLGRQNDPFVAGDFWANSSAQLERLSPTEKPTISGRMHTDQSEGGYSYSLSAEKSYSGGTLLGEGRGRRGPTKTDIPVASIEKSKSLECYKEEHLYSEHSSMWIFPNNTKHFCVTAAGNRVMNFLESGPPESKSHQMKSSSLSGEERKENDIHKDQEGSQSTNDSSSETSPGNASGGRFGKVIKIAIIVGFGVLVLLTRQREPRKSKRGTDELSLAASEFLDEQSTNEE